MKVIRQDPAVAAVSADPMFVGEVALQTLVGDDDAMLLRVASVTFVDGARNRWHHHGADQVLIVTAGDGIVASGTEERAVTVGDVILVPAGERHWHGAAPGARFTHFAVLTPGPITLEE